MSDGSVTFYLDPPVRGTIRENGKLASWIIETVSASPLERGQEPPSASFVTNCHKVFRNASGKPVPVAELAQLDLKQSLRDAFNREFGAALREARA